MTTPESGREPSEMVRRVAEALCKAAGEKPDRVWQREDDQTSALGWEFYVTEAEAAIQAMRKASKPMSDAGWARSEKADRDWVSCTPQQLWSAMIDAALGAGQAEGEG